MKPMSCVPLVVLALAGCGGGDGPTEAPLESVVEVSDGAAARPAGAAASVAIAPPAQASAATAAPLQIRRQPLGADVHDGAIAEFSVEAQGPGPLSYQWLRDDESIDGETGPRLRLPVTASDDRVRISVVVRAGGTTLHSAPALLRVGRT